MISTIERNTARTETDEWPKLVTGPNNSSWTIIYPGGQVLNVDETPEMRSRAATVAGLISSIRSGILKPPEHAERHLKLAREAQFKTFQDTMFQYGLGVTWVREEGKAPYLQPSILRGHGLHAAMMQRTAA